MGPDPGVRAAVEKYRRSVLDRAVGRMTVGMNWATEGILDLARGAASESVKLSAPLSGPSCSHMMAVSIFGGLEDRLTQVEEKVNAGHRRTHRTP